MKTVHVQFYDSREEDICALFGSVQDSNHYPHQGVVDDSDPRYQTYYNRLPEFMKEGWPAPTGL